MNIVWVYDIGIVRAGPILGFLVAATVLAELSDRAGVFDVAATACARLARGRTPVLFLLVAVLATVVTIGMGLDTTAVLLTPVVLAATQRLGLRAIPFALVVIWLANTASLLLPVSNLTNLLALQHGNMTTLAFARQMALPELAAVVVTVGYLGLWYRRDLIGRYPVPQPALPGDRTAFTVCAIACAALGPAVLAGVAPWLAATVCAVPALAVFAVRQRKALQPSLFPWRLVLLTEALFLAVGALTHLGLAHVIARLVGDSAVSATVVAAVSSNLVNNLPAYLAIEPAVSPDQLFATLLGTNAGPLVLMWGSLATLLWADRCRARGIRVSPIRFAMLGLGGVPLVLLAATAAGSVW